MKRTLNQCLALVLILILTMLLLSGCAFFNRAAPITGIWSCAKQEDLYSILVIKEETLFHFSVQTAEAVNAETVESLLADTPAYTYTYAFSDEVITISADSEQISYEEQYVVSQKKDEQLLLKPGDASSLADTRFLDGAYTYVAKVPETTDYKNAEGLLTQAFIQGNWLQTNDEAAEFNDNPAGLSNGYSILSIHDDTYSTIFDLSTTLSLETGQYSETLGFRAAVSVWVSKEDGTRADLFYTFTVKDDFTLQISAVSPIRDTWNHSGLYHILLTNAGIYLTARQAGEAALNGCYAKRDAAGSIEGVWWEPVNDLNGYIAVTFSAFQDGVHTSSGSFFDLDETVDYSDAMSLYEDSNNIGTQRYSSLENGLIFYPNICWWPVFVTDSFCVVGFSDAPTALPNRWEGFYRVM